MRFIAALLLLTTPALAQTPYVYTPLGYQQITLSSLSSLTNIPSAARSALICIETAAIRWRDDGTAPTSSVGQPVASGSCFQYGGALGSIQFIAQTGTPVVDVTYYR